MLSMSSDTIESYGSREITHVDYGYSRSSTPDSSASSRLAAQLERSAYRRSRSKTRRKQNSKQSDVDSGGVSARKPSRNKRLKQQQRSQSCDGDEYYARMNGTTNPSIRRLLNSDGEQTTENTEMRKPTKVEQYSKDRNFVERDNGRILTAQPVSATYTVSCVTGYEEYPRHTVETPSRHSESATATQPRRSRVDLARNGTNGKNSDRIKEAPKPATRKVSPEQQNVCEDKLENKNNKSVNVSKVRFQECWEDGPSRKPEYKVREASGMVISIRDDTPVYKRSDNQRIVNGDASHLDAREYPDNTSIALDRSVKDNQEKGQLNLQAEDKFTGTKTNGHIVSAKENYPSRKRDLSASRLDSNNRLDTEHPQTRSDVTRPEESKPLGLRQLIKIHEIQIANVAKSAASMKRPLSGKAHEGRLVKVKIVPEIETKQSPVKQNTAKVTFAGNKSSSDNALPRKMPSPEARSNFIEPVSKSEVVSEINAVTMEKARVTVKPKRHTVELRSKPSREDRKWKRHTAIGLVGFEYQGNDAPHGEWSPRERGSRKLFSNTDSDGEVEYLKKQPVEPEEQIVAEEMQICETSPTSPAKNESNDIWKIPNEPTVVDDESEVPPERPPLPKNFYSSTEEILVRPPPPNFANDIENNATLDFKPRSDNLPRTEFTPEGKPNVECFSNGDSKPTVDYVPKTDVKPNIAYVPSKDIKTNIEFAPKQEIEPNTKFQKTDFKSGAEYRRKSALSGPSRFMPHALSNSLPAIHVSTAIVQAVGENILEHNNAPEKDYVLGKTVTTREMYEERLARINLIPLDVPERHSTNPELVPSLYSSVESFAWDTSRNIHNASKNDYLEKLKTCMKQMKMLTKQKEDLEENYERERRDWKRKYEEQQKVANAYQKLEDRYRRQVQELQEALKLCRCTDIETRKALFLGQSWKRNDPYFVSTQTQSILDETEEWLKAHSVRSDITYNSENISNTRIQTGQSSHGSLTDIMGTETKWAMDYSDIALTTGIDQYNGTSV